MMVMMAMVMVSAKVITVLEAHRQVGWLRQRQHPSCHRLKAFLANASTNSECSIGQTLAVENSTPPDARLSPEGSQAGFEKSFQAGTQAGSPRCVTSWL